MTTEAQPLRSERRASLTDLLIVDSDVHVHESPGALAPYCDMPWRIAVENVADVPERYLDIPGFSPLGDGTLTAKFPSAHEGTRMVHDADQMRAELSKIDVDLAVLFPDHLLKLPVLPQIDYAAALARAYNAWLVDKWASQEKGLLGCIVACPHDPDDAAREIEKYAGEPGIVGVYLPCAGLDPLWGHRKYNPIWEAAQEADFPVLLHAVTVTSPAFPFNNHGFNTELARHSTSHTFSIIANIVDLITNGVVVRYPELRFGVTEAGISWMPFLCNRLDKEYLERRRDVPFLVERPSYYLKQFFIATQPIEEPDDASDIVKLIELYHGEDTTIFASDWPHHDFDHPMKVDQVPFSEEQRQKVFGLNALRLFNIDSEGRRLKL